MTHDDQHDDQHDDPAWRQPADEANRAMGDGDAARAVERATQVIELLEQSSGPADEGVLAWRGFRARALIDALRCDEAVQELDDLLAIRTEISGPDARSTLRIRADLVRAFMSAGRSVEAVRLAEALLADRRRVHGDDDPQTSEARSLLDESLRQLFGETGGLDRDRPDGSG